LLFFNDLHSLESLFQGMLTFVFQPLMRMLGALSAGNGGYVRTNR